MTITSNTTVIQPAVRMLRTPVKLRPRNIGHRASSLLELVAMAANIRPLVPSPRTHIPTAPPLNHKANITQQHQLLLQRIPILANR